MIHINIIDLAQDRCVVRVFHSKYSVKAPFHSHKLVFKSYEQYADFCQRFIKKYDVRFKDCLTKYQWQYVNGNKQFLN